MTAPTPRAVHAPSGPRTSAVCLVDADERRRSPAAGRSTARAGGRPRCRGTGTPRGCARRRARRCTRRRAGRPSGRTASWRRRPTRRARRRRGTTARSASNNAESLSTERRCSGEPSDEVDEPGVARRRFGELRVFGLAAVQHREHRRARPPSDSKYAVARARRPGRGARRPPRSAAPAPRSPPDPRAARVERTTPLAATRRRRPARAFRSASCARLTGGSLRPDPPGRASPV